MILRLLTLLGVLSVLSASPVFALEKWLYVSKNLQVDASVGELDTLMGRASAAGYTHVMLTDSKMARLGTLGDIYPRYERNTRSVQELAKKYNLEIVPAVFHIGYSNNMLFNDPNLVEAMPVKSVPLVVKGGVAQVAVQTVSLPGGDFSDLKKWSWKDKNIVADEGTARLEADGEVGRLSQKLKVDPWRQYHVSVRIKTKDLRGAMPEIKALASKGGAALTWSNLGVKPTQDWTTHHAVFNSQDQTEVNLYFGTWGAKSGSLWWDDAKIEEVAFLNMPRRPGCPLSITTADGKPLMEGTDFEKLSDERMGTKPWPGEYDVYHEPPVLRTKLPDGTRLFASYYHAMTVYDGQAMICPSEPRTTELLRDEARRVHALWGAKGYMMQHDECRMMNWCEACQRRGMTPGKMLAENVRACAAILREVNPGGRIYTWSDMFDPNHNAVKGPYYLVNGPLTGSWEGLDKDIIILPWYFEKRAESLKFFADRGHKQVIAGYYDDRPEKVKEWLSAAKTVPGSVIGVMYTTWQSNYSDMEALSRAIGE
jgi:hypothetical protein